MGTSTLPKMSLTAKVGTNADLFPDILDTYVPKGSFVVDVTWGRGVFWRNVNTADYNLVATDLVRDGVDCRSLPYRDECMDAVVLDPPYIHTSGSIKESLAKCYRNNDSTQFKNFEDVKQLYRDAIVEARRVLKPKGILIVKCQDTIESGKPRWIHNEIMGSTGFICEDVFVLVQQSKPMISSRWKVIRHARKNHSYFIVLRKHGPNQGT